MKRIPSIYLAGPEVFFPDAVAIGAAKRLLCAEAGFLGLFPFDNEAPPGTQDSADAIYRANVAMMRCADAGIFNLSPFRGPSADVGTAFELGMMAALGKPVFAFSTASGDLATRVSGTSASNGQRLDVQGNAIEDFGLADNLMLDCTLREQSRAIVRGTDGWRNGFLACLQQAKRAFLQFSQSPDHSNAT